MNFPSRIFLLSLVGTFAAGLATPASAAPLTISDAPLFLGARVKPNFMFMIDDSNSMQSHTLVGGVKGGNFRWDATATVQNFFDASHNLITTGGTTFQVLIPDHWSNYGGNPLPPLDEYGFARSFAYNKLYFNPTTTYSPWAHGDGTFDTNATPSNAWVDSRDFDTDPALPPTVRSDLSWANYGRINLVPSATTVSTQLHGAVALTRGITVNCANTSAVASSECFSITAGTDVLVRQPFDFMAGMTIPLSTAANPVWYFVNANAACGTGTKRLGTAAGSRKTWVEATNTVGANPDNTQPGGFPLKLTGDCLNKVTMEYYPATFFLTTPKIPDYPDGTSHTDFGWGAGGEGTGVPVLQSDGVTTLYKFEIKPGNFDGGNNLAGVNYYTAAAQNFANWYTYYINRTKTLIASETQALDPIVGMRVGYSALHEFVQNSSDPSPGTAIDVSMYDMDISADRASLYKKLRDLDNINLTPTRQAIQYAVRQFKRTNAGKPIVSACSTNATMVFTDGFTVDPNNDTAQPDGTGVFQAIGNIDSGTGAPFQDSFSNTIADAAAQGYYDSAGLNGYANLRTDLPAGKYPIDTGCVAGVAATAQSDQTLDCNPNPHMKLYGVVLGAEGAQYGNGIYIDDPSTATDEAKVAAFTTAPVWVTTGGTANVASTFDGKPEATDDLWHGTLNSRGSFINASSASEVQAGLSAVLADVGDADQTSGSLALTGARVGADSFAITPTFNVGNNGHNWSGELTSNAIDSNGSLSTELWKATDHIPNFASRNIYMGTKSGPNSTRTVSAFNSSLVSVPLLGLTALDVANFFPGANKTQIVNYLRGDDSLEEKNVGGKFRNRSRADGTATPLGDIIGSVPQIAKSADNYGYSFFSGSFSAVGTSYTTYLTTNKPANMPHPLVFVGANDGMLHGFNAEQLVADGGGTELFAYIPNSILAPNRAGGSIRSFGGLANPNYAHSFFVDGPIAISDGCASGCPGVSSWKTMLVAGSGAGAKGVFGIDISKVGSVALGAGDVKWELNGDTTVDAANAPDVGYVYGKPVIVPVLIGAVPTWVAIVPNGYNSTGDKAFLFVIDLFTGVVLKKIATDSATSNGLGQIAVTDSKLNGTASKGIDGFADTVYGGDLQGRMWKFDLSSTLVASWGLAYGTNPMFTAKDSLGNSQPITGGLEIAAGPGGNNMVYFGTGRYLISSDAAPSTAPPIETQTLYAVLDSAASGLRANLQVQTIDSQTAAVIGPPAIPASRQTSSNSVDYSLVRGWYMDLVVAPATTGTGEMFLGTPLIQSGTIFYTTFDPAAADECTPGGINWLYGLGALTGINKLGGTQVGIPQTGIACTGDCGAIGIAAGAPVLTIAASIPVPTCRPGVDVGCNVPLTCAAQGLTGSDCTTYEAGLLTQSNTSASRCSVVITTSGSDQLVLDRVCGRNAWRQVR